MAVLSVQDITRAGLNPSFVAAEAGGDQLPNDNMTFFYMKNSDASPHTATATSTAPISPGLAQENLSMTVPAGEERMFGPFPVRSYSNNAERQVAITYDGVTGVTVAAIRLNSAT